eukprot:COSAG02_NODE_881_length_16214_cov_5.907726_11_plen_77_part_00
MVLLLLLCRDTVPKNYSFVTEQDMVLDFAPLFNTLHEESCMKNQELGGPNGAHCFWLKLKPEAERNSSGNALKGPN